MPWEESLKNGVPWIFQEAALLWWLRHTRRDPPAVQEPGVWPKLKVPGEGDGYPYLIYLAGESHGRRAWRAAVHGVFKVRHRPVWLTLTLTWVLGKWRELERRELGGGWHGDWDVTVAVERKEPLVPLWNPQWVFAWCLLKKSGSYPSPQSLPQRHRVSSKGQILAGIHNSSFAAMTFLSRAFETNLGREGSYGGGLELGHSLENLFRLYQLGSD